METDFSFEISGLARFRVKTFIKIAVLVPCFATCRSRFFAELVKLPTHFQKYRHLSARPHTRDRTNRFG
jgi:hypothetical protein